MRVIRRLFRTTGPAIPFLFIAACTTVPEETEQARGVLGGLPLVLALSVIVLVVAVGMIVAAVGLDRMVRTRRELAEGPPVEEEEEVEPSDEVVAGITVGRAPAPRWLYGVYVLIPVFAFAYIFSNIAPEPAAETPAETAAPEGPCTECTIAAAQIAFDKDVLEVAAETEITVAFDNNDTGVPHDFTVWESEEPGSGKQVETTGTVGGGASGTVTFESPAEGTTWSFTCTIHPASMIGTIEPVAAS